MQIFRFLHQSRGPRPDKRTSKTFVLGGRSTRRTRPLIFLSVLLVGLVVAIALAAVVFISGIFSAFLVNDAICLVLTPLVLELTLAVGRRPVPYLLAFAMASNVGSTATITGNPQNIMVGSLSHIRYATFATGRSRWPAWS